MAGEQPIIEVEIKHSHPIAIGDFVGLFASLSSQYERYVRQQRPDLSPEANLYIKEIHAGSIVAELLPLALAAPVLLDHMSSLMMIEDFIVRWGGRVKKYLIPGGRDETATRSDVKDIIDSVAAISRDTDGEIRLKAIAIEDGKRDLKVAIQFNTKEAQVARLEAERHLIELAKPETADYQRVMMVFVQSNTKSAQPGKRTSERVVIRAISDRDLPIIYGTPLVEQRIKHEIVDEDENVYKKGFVVDVIVESNPNTRRPAAYRVMALHQVIELDGSEEE